MKKAQQVEDIPLQAFKLMHDFFLRAYQERDTKKCTIINDKIFKMVQGHFKNAVRGV